MKNEESFKLAKGDECMVPAGRPVMGDAKGDGKNERNCKIQYLHVGTHYRLN